MTRKRATYGTGPLSRPSMPEFPRWPSRNNIRKWLQRRGKAEQKGIDLLVQHYGRKKSPRGYIELLQAFNERRLLGRPEIQSEVESLRNLLLVLAAQHVPYFGVRSKKRATIDNHVLARLLRDYQQALKKGYRANVARRKAALGLPGNLASASDGRIANLISRARVLFRNIVNAKRDGSIIVRGPFEERMWKFHLGGPPNEIEGVIEPSAHDPDAITVYLPEPKITQ